MDKRKSFWMILILAFAFFTSGLQAPVFAAEQAKQGTISVIGMDESAPLLTETTVQYGEKETAFDALVQAVGENNVTFEQFDFGKMISGIYGLEGTSDYTYYWNFFINGISAQVGADSYVVQDGDKLSFKYSSGAPEKSASISIVGNDNKDLIPPLSNVGFFGEPTAFQLLKVVVGSDKLNYKTFSVNGASVAIDPNSYKLQSGDKISFQYDSWGEKPTVEPVSKEILQSAIDRTAGYYSGVQVDEWAAIALKQAGKNIPTNYLENVRKLVKDSQGKFRKITDSERYTLGILAAGGDPTNIEGYNLVEAIYNGDVTKQGLNGVAYALIA